MGHIRVDDVAMGGGHKKAVSEATYLREFARRLLMYWHKLNNYFCNYLFGDLYFYFSCTKENSALEGSEDGKRLDTGVPFKIKKIEKNLQDDYLEEAG